jgi:HD-GYP domain-containing protein (c-di-GMP phosphodiesterase class II)
MENQTRYQPRARSGAGARARTGSLPGPLPLLETLNDVARSLCFVEGRGAPLDAAVAGVMALLNADGVAILERRRSGEYAFRKADGQLAEWQGFSLSGDCARLLDTLSARDEIVLFKRAQRSPWAREFLFAAGMHWGALAPIRVRDERVGALLVNQASSPHVREEHVAGLRNLATLTGVAILEARKHAKLEEVFMGVIVSLTMALEAKDPYTEGHSVRVAAYSEAIGKQLGLGPDMLDVIHRSCLVHDIGKIAVDEAILTKDGKLSEQEREKMDMHVLIGESILRPLRILHPLLPGVRSHHENFDGSGYPDRLKGEAIPLEARVMAVADAFDAMTTDRPYRNALPGEASLAELRRAAGTQFDPRVVAAFEQIFPAVKRTLQTLRPRWT